MTDDKHAVKVPYTSLQPSTLRAVIEEFVTRDTTDYGERERTLEEKVEDIMRQLRRGEAKVVFDAETGTVNIVVARQHTVTSTSARGPDFRMDRLARRPGKL